MHDHLSILISGRQVSAEYLAALGVMYLCPSSEEEVAQIARERHYCESDIVTISPENLGTSYESKLDIFFHEHIHEDEEIRFICDGRGYFDVRNESDSWLRIALDKNDLIILPAGIYHRFSTDETNFVKAMRLFKKDPSWTPLNRDPGVDCNPFRLEYLKSLPKSIDSNAG
ncbi:1,2-dihydroxy-3-keto-5-methylthiopentene dioxygenase [Blumeria hordei DH14]|uniref:Acireductone dioxygenase n=1 Tax=Blumeria graminis f. sp. hordei (strain DH14) TaxID=546991 RepID=N1JLU5_BLUG1|nr:1,2-dihydroxy-3-keto-5-methylthiopentene dioxygenase [Blumeria hordei DH14]